MIAKKDPYIQCAYDRLQLISQDKQMQLAYEAREKAIRDHNQFLFEAEQRGIKIGEQRGIEIGEQRGREEGMELAAVSIALNLISLGMDDATVIHATHLSPDQVKALRKNSDENQSITS